MDERLFTERDLERAFRLGVDFAGRVAEAVLGMSRSPPLPPEPIDEAILIAWKKRSQRRLRPTPEVA